MFTFDYLNIPRQHTTAKMAHPIAVRTILTPAHGREKVRAIISASKAEKVRHRHQLKRENAAIPQIPETPDNLVVQTDKNR